MIRYRAPWVLPICEPPIRNGYVDCADGRIVAVGAGDGRMRPAGGEVALAETAILPGLVNAHTHLELSGLRGRIERASSLPVWVRRILGRADDPATMAEDAIVSAIEEAWRTGTALVGDVSNTLAPVAPLGRTRRLAAVVFREVIGFPAEMASSVVDRAVEDIAAAGQHPDVRLTLSAHAPYSVGPATFRALRAFLRQRGLAPTTVHLGESREEIEFLETGEGPWRSVLEERGRWDPRWQPPATDPATYLDRLGWLAPDTIVVHGVHLTDASLALLARRGVTLATCPRSNAWTGAGVPPLARFYASGVGVAIGTDSLASAPDLNLFAELAEVRRLVPFVPARSLLASATIQGARALGFEVDFGSIAPGRRSALLAVRVPARMVDVEEYLVGGVTPDAVRWLEAPAGTV